MGWEVSDACRFCIERGISNKKSGQITRYYVSLLRIAFFFIMSCFSNITLIFSFNNCCHKKSNPINFTFQNLSKIFVQPILGGRKILTFQISLVEFKISWSAYFFWFILLAVLFPMHFFSVSISSFPSKIKEIWTKNIPVTFWKFVARFLHRKTRCYSLIN